MGMEIKPQASIAEFFYDVVTAAIRNQGVATSEPTECYLVNLLATFTKSPPDDAPLGIRLASAAQASPDERIRELREIGDTSLYVSGFFSESLERRLVDVDYYITVGGTAYGQLAQACRGRKDSIGEVYDELGQKFPQYVDVFAEISEQSALSSNLGVVQLYERWLRTGSAYIERRLRKRGLIPKKGDVQ
jgi:hypothetical protein